MLRWVVHSMSGAKIKLDQKVPAHASFMPFFYKSKQKLNQAYFIIKKYCYENDLKIELQFFLLTTGTSFINCICCF